MPALHIRSLHSGQRYVIKHARRHNVIVAGRKWRKTTLLALIAVEAALLGDTVMWAAPTQDQCRQGLKECSYITREVTRYSTLERTLHFNVGGNGTNHGCIIFRSMDNYDSARSHNVDVVIVDEAQDIKPEAWIEVLSKLTLASANPRTYLIGTPKTVGSFFHQQFLQALAREDSAAFNAPTLGCRIITLNGISTLERVPHQLENDTIPWEVIQYEFETSTLRAFRQEILANWATDGGNVFTGVGDCIDLSRTENEDYEEHHVYTAGCDLARYDDFTSITVLDETGRQVYQERWNDLAWEIQLPRIVEIINRYHAKLVVDVTSQSSIEEELERRIGYQNLIGFNFTAESKLRVIENLQLAFEKRTIKLMNLEDQTKELFSYEFQKSSSGYIKMNAPSGQHDDMVTSLALAAWTCLNPPQPNIVRRGTDTQRGKQRFRFH